MGHQALGNSGVDRNFNIEQMEDCDISTDDICKIRWLNCVSQKLDHEVIVAIICL